jgi:CheY-like chemotaxis protein/HPt (histidine-containing phosphotransfer) domain-containing protein
MAQRLPLRILLAEDYVVNQKVALRLLAQMGYRADVAANGLEAIQALERQPYDVVLMDVQMPEMDGLEATRQICARWPVGERPRIIAMTTNAMQGDREMCLAAGMDDYVSKPIRVEELVQALARCRPVVQSEAPASAEAETQRSSRMPSPEILDPAVFAKLVDNLGGDIGFLRELVEAYLASSPGILASLRQAMAAGDAPAFQRAAHSFKTGSASFGALAFAAQCKELEEMGKAGVLGDAESKVAALGAAYGEVVAALRARVQSAGSVPE